MNITPEFTVEADTFEAARDLWLTEMRTIHRMVNKDFALELPVKQSQYSAKTTELVCWASGTKVPFDPVTHRYGDGEWLSGSAFAHKFTPRFESDVIAGRMAAKHGVDAADIQAMWAKNGEASSAFGTSVHAALELYGRYAELSKWIKGSDESALTKNPVLRPIVEAFFADHEHEPAEYEVFVADKDRKLCGQIDRLRMVDFDEDKINKVRVQDFKTNADLSKRQTILDPFKGVVDNTTLGLYQLQLSFYAAILEKHGYTVEGLDIFHLNGSKWDTYSLDVVDISDGLELC